MPLDSTGNYRHNTESAIMHSKAAGKTMEEKPEAPEGEHTEVHNHGDGTFHTVHGGEEVQHESIGHMHAHLSQIHGEEGHAHFHAHHDGVSMKTHGVKSGEEPESREHDGVEGAHEHLDDTMGEDHEEPDGDEQGQSAGLESMYK